MDGVKLHFRTFVHATEDPERVRTALLFVMGATEEPEGRSRLRTSHLRGHHGNRLEILEATLARRADVRRFFGRLTTEAPALLDTLRSEVTDRFDEAASAFHFRLDKQAAVQARWGLIRQGDAVQVEVRVARHPGRDPRQTVHDLLEGPAAPRRNPRKPTNV